MGARSALNADFARLPYWHTTMPPLPSRRDRALPTEVDVVVVGGGYAGVAAARELARRGASVTVLEAQALGSGASTRSGGIVRPGYKRGPAELVKRHGEDLARRVFDETRDAYRFVKKLILEEAIECDFRESGYVQLAAAPAHVSQLRKAAEDLESFDVHATYVPRESLQAEIGSAAYYGGLVVPSSGLLDPGKYFAGLVAAALRAGADLHEGVPARAIERRAGGQLVVKTDRGLIATKEVIIATNGYTGSLVPALRRRVVPIGSYIIATEPLPEELARSLSPKGRAFFDSKNLLYYWHISADRRMIFGGRASFWPTSIERTAAILYNGLLDVHPQLAGYRVDHAWGGNIGFTVDKMPHIGRLDAITYVLGCCGSGIAMMTWLGTAAGRWLSGDPAPALSRLRLPLVPVPFEGRPWFLPVAGEWFRLRDRLAARSR